MKERKQGIIEYLFLSIALLGMLDGLFVGFYSTTYHFPFLVGFFLLFLCLQGLFSRFPITRIFAFIATTLLCVGLHKMLLNGFYLIYNKMAEQINYVFDMGFYYYIEISTKNGTRDCILFVVVLLLFISIFIHFIRNKTTLLMILIGIGLLCLLVLTPYHIGSSFFFCLVGMIGYFGIHKSKTYVSIGIIFVCLFLGALEIPNRGNLLDETPLKSNLLTVVRTISQGNQYAVRGGIGTGDIGNIGTISPKGVELFIVQGYNQENDLYLKGFVSSHFKDNQWEEEESEAVLVAGENSMQLPFLQLESKELDSDLVASKTTLSIEFQKLNDEYMIWPYFSDLTEMSGFMKGDVYIKRNGNNKKMSLSYYPVFWNKIFSLDLSSSKDRESSMGIDYQQGMEEYNQIARNDNLEIQQDLKEKIRKKFPQLNKNDSLATTVEKVQTILKTGYQYTYEPGTIPSNENGVWYFLNQSKKGYCSHFASSAVMMFRSVGIPSRYVEGYKIDRKNLQGTTSIQVTDYSAHAWAEVYVDDLGWIPIEVTNSTQVPLDEQEYENISNRIVENKAKSKIGIKNQIKRQLPNVVLIIVIIVTILLGRKCFLFLYEKRKLFTMNRRQKVIYYYHIILENVEKKPETAEKLNMNLVESIYHKARYSQHSIEKNELKIIKRYCNILRKK